MLETRREIVRWIAERLTVVSAAWLAAGLAFSAFVIWAFTELVDVVVEGDSRVFDRAALLWIHSTLPGWLDGPMRIVTALGYYWFVVALLVVVVVLFYRRGWKLSAILLLVSTAGSAVLTTVLKSVFQRARPELFDSGYHASFYSFPSGHATVAVGLYGMLTLVLAYRLRGAARWAVVVSGIFVVLLIGFSRLYLGVHYPTDIVAGYLAALLWLVCVGAVYALWLSVRSFRVAESSRGEG
ncbi:MAG TPA: phosphatase PAP2 family protein [Rubrobacter sp.]|jgi:undecaprenyl-diphosphatase|nr:phosphatase PAP2 family protein [Rubrobacter sp.]